MAGATLARTVETLLKHACWQADFHKEERTAGPGERVRAPEL